jgi:RNA polymerase sigma-70 factor, ECF subfamily
MSSSSRQTRYSSLSLQEIIGLCAGPRDDEAWEEFVSRVGKPIGQAITRTACIWGAPSRALVQDIAQVTFLKLWHGGLQLLHEFAVERPEAILSYVKKAATNATYDYFKHERNQSSGGDRPHVSITDMDPEAGNHVDGSADRMNHDLFLQQIDDMLQRCLAGPDQDRDRTIFWLYFRQGMTTQEIASLPTIDLGPKGVGSVIERLKHLLREQVLGGELEIEASGIKAKSHGISY